MKKIEIVLYAISGFSFLTVAYLFISGQGFIILSSSELAFLLSILGPLEILIASLLLGFSYISYRIDGQFRSLVFFFVAVNLIITGLFYMVTNVAMIGISPFANRDRNRTLIMLFGFVLSPGVLFGTLGEQISKMRKYGFLLWSGIVMPLLNLWFFISPDPVFVSVQEGEGLGRIALISWLIAFAVVLSALLAIVKLVRTYRNHRNSLDLALLLSLIHWIVASTLLLIQQSPLSFQEIIWFSIVISGILIQVVGIAHASIIYPLRKLEEEVTLRTTQYEKAMSESEYILNMWSHKIGNLLQGIFTYLELLEEEQMSFGHVSSYLTPSMQLGQSASIINRQVSVLSELKSHAPPNSPVNLLNSIHEGVMQAIEIFGAQAFYVHEPDVRIVPYVKADEYLKIIFVNMIAFALEMGSYPTIEFEILTPQIQYVEILCRLRGIIIASDIKDSLIGEMNPQKTILGLDLFTIRLLIEKYGGIISYEELGPSDIQLKLQIPTVIG